jgi:hypothetical protein
MEIGRAVGISIMVAISFCAACQDSRGPVSIKSDDPDLQILAMKRDVACDNRDDIPAMVNDLQSDDPAIRFYAIEGLHRLTHDDFGYHYYDTDDERAPGLARWKKWLQQQK